MGNMSEKSSAFTFFAQLSRQVKKNISSIPNYFIADVFVGTCVFITMLFDGQKKLRKVRLNKKNSYNFQYNAFFT